MQKLTMNIFLIKNNDNLFFYKQGCPQHTYTYLGIHTQVYSMPTNVNNMFK